MVYLQTKRLERWVNYLMVITLILAIPPAGDYYIKTFYDHPKLTFYNLYWVSFPYTGVVEVPGEKMFNFSFFIYNQGGKTAFVNSIRISHICEDRIPPLVCEDYNDIIITPQYFILKPETAQEINVVMPINKKRLNESAVLRVNYEPKMKR